MTKVSLIIPLYNSAKTLEKVLHKVSASDYHNFEILAIDSENSEADRQITEQYGGIYIDIPENNIAHKRNHGAALATGDILCFLDDDCLIEPDTLSNIVKILDNPENLICGNHRYQIPENSHWVSKVWKLHLDTFQQENTTWLPTTCLAVSKKDFNSVEGFNTELEASEDVDFCYRLQAKHPQRKIINSELIRHTHLKNPDSLIDFIFKEVWRSKNSRTVVREQKSLKDWIYLGIPLYLIALIISLKVLIYCLVTDRANLKIYIWTLIVLIPLLSLAIYTAIKSKRLFALPKLVVVYFCYLFSRSIGAIRS